MLEGVITPKRLVFDYMRKFFIIFAVAGLLSIPAILRAQNSGVNHQQPNNSTLATSINKGHDLPRLRGTMIGSNVTADDLRVLGVEWKANLIRWQLSNNEKSPANEELNTYDLWLEKKLTNLDRLLPECAQSGLLVLIALHTTPGGRDEKNRSRLFKEKKYQDKFIKNWEMIARRYRGNKTIWGYDLANEPEEGRIAFGVEDWQSLSKITAQKIRAIDPDHAIIVEPANGGNPEGLARFKPLPVPGIIYSVHMYLPHNFTHQGVSGRPTNPDLAYPGIINNEMWDKNRLRLALKPVVDFQKKYGVHVYIGEFSAIRWAPNDSAYNYLKDVIDIFEENEWDWTYHAFREWNGWSVEHSQDKTVDQPTKTPTNREQLLRYWFSKNIKPAE